MELFDAAQSLLVEAVQKYTFSAGKKQRSFYAKVSEDLDDAILKGLDELGVETIDPSDLATYCQNGDQAEIDRITELVRPFDRDILHHRFGRRLTAEEIERRMGYHSVESRLRKALRCLRRPPRSVSDDCGTSPSEPNRR